MFEKMPLRTKATLVVIALGTLPVIGCGAMAYHLADKNMVESDIQSQQSTAVSLSDKVNRFLFERYGDIQAIANLPTLTNPKIAAGMTPQAKQEVLNKYIKIYQVYDSLAVFDLNGNELLESSGKALDNHKDRDYFQQVIQTGQPVISNPEVSKSTGKLVIHFAAPIKEITTGKMIGVVGSRMPIKAVEAVAVNFGNDGKEWHLIDNSSGKFFAASEKNQVGKDPASDYTNFAQMQAANKVNSAVDVSQIDQAEQLVTYAPFKKLEGLPQLNWSTIIAEDTKDVFATQKNLLWTLMLGTGVTALLGSGLAVILANRTTKFIKGITNAIASSSTEIAAMVEQQERTVSQQAASVNQTTATMDELGASSQQSAEQAEASALRSKTSFSASRKWHTSSARNNGGNVNPQRKSECDRRANFTFE